MWKKWRDVGRSIKRAIFSENQVHLMGRAYRVGYESRTAREDRDYQILQELAKDKRCVFDIGANVGITSLLMSSVIDETGKIYAFEASEDACRVLVENISLNQLDCRIEVINALVSEESGQTLDFYWDFTSGGASLVSGYLGHSNPLRKVALAIDDFVNQKGVQPDFMKIDVEGAESRVIAGMKHVLDKVRPVIFVELHSWGDVTVKQNANMILASLAPVNYKMVYLRKKEIVEDVEIFTGRGRCHVLCAPAEYSIPPWLYKFDTSRI